MIWQIVAFKCIFNKWHSITMRHKLCRALTLDALASRPVACFPCVLCKTSLSDSTVMDKSRLEFPPENLMIVSGLLRNKHNVVFTCMKWCRMWNSAWDANVRVCNCVTISVDEWNVPVQLLLFIIIIVVIIIIMIIIIIKKKEKKKSDMCFYSTKYTSSYRFDGCDQLGGTEPSFRCSKNEHKSSLLPFETMLRWTMKPALLTKEVNLLWTQPMNNTDPEHLHRCLCTSPIITRNIDVRIGSSWRSPISHEPSVRHLL